MTEEAKVIMEFMQSENAQALRYARIVVLVVIYGVWLLFSMHKRFSEGLSSTNNKIDLVSKDVEHVKTSIEEIKNKQQ